MGNSDGLLSTAGIGSVPRPSDVCRGPAGGHGTPSGGCGQGGEALSNVVGHLVTAIPLPSLHDLARELTANDVLHTP